MDPDRLVRIVRDRPSLSLRELSRETGLSPSRIWQILRGRGWRWSARWEILPTSDGPTIDD